MVRQATSFASVAPEDGLDLHAGMTPVTVPPRIVATTTDTTEDLQTVVTTTAVSEMRNETTGLATEDPAAVTELSGTATALVAMNAGTTERSAAEVLMRTEVAMTTRKDPGLHTAGETNEIQVINSDKNKLSLKPSDRLPISQVLICL